MNKSLQKFDFEKVERETIVCGILPKSLAKNVSFLTMYGGNPGRVFKSILKNIKPVENK